MNINFDFADNKVLVVGGSRGIGQQVCLEFFSSGADVSYVSRTECKRLREYGIKHLRCDVRDPDQIKKVFNQIEKIDILINVAATNYCKKIHEINIDEWNEVLEVNLRSYFLTTKIAVEKMKNRGGGKIVNVSSIAGRNKSIVSGSHYTSSKSAIIGLTRQIASEVGIYGINVNAVCPSQTMTDMLKESMSHDDIEKLSNQIPLKRLATVKDQALPILFLCSSGASYMTGAVLDINGGQL